MKTKFIDFIKESYETFEEWFDIFADEVQHLGYSGPIMDDTFIEDWENDKCPYKSAKEFVQEMNEEIKLDIEVGDELRGGRFKNKKTIVKKISKDKYGDPLINNKPLLKFRTYKKEK